MLESVDTGARDIITHLFRCVCGKSRDTTVATKPETCIKLNLVLRTFLDPVRSYRYGRVAERRTSCCCNFFRPIADEDGERTSNCEGTLKQQTEFSVVLKIQKSGSVRVLLRKLQRHSGAVWSSSRIHPENKSRGFSMTCSANMLLC